MFERTIKFRPAFDRSEEGYGVHGVELCFFLKGPKGVIQFIVGTSWHLPHVQSRMDVANDSRFPHLFHKPSPSDLGYHSPVPMYEGQPSMGPCKLLDGAECYYDGSGLNAIRVFNILVEKGDEGVWAELEETYSDRFEEPTI